MDGNGCGFLPETQPYSDPRIKRPLSAIRLAFASVLTSELFVFDQPAIELIGKCLAIFGAEVRWAAAHLATAPELVNSVSHCKSLTDIGVCIESAARIDSVCAFRHHVGSEWNIGCNNQITQRYEFDNSSIRDIGTVSNEHGIDKFGPRNA